MTAHKELNEKLNTLIKNNATQQEIWKICGEYVKNGQLTKDEVYNLLLAHSQHVQSNEMEDILCDLLDLYSGYCSPLCKLY